MQWTAVSSRQPARSASVRASALAMLLLAQHAVAAAVDYSHVIPVSDSAINASVSSGKLHGRFLHITDMHPDMFYKAHTSTSESIACHRGKGPAGYYGAETSDCDSPVQLVDSALAWIRENIKNEIDFVIWTGDSARHDSDEEIPRNASQVLGTNKLMVKKMLEVFSDETGKLEVPIIPSLGNNDILPHNILLPAPNKWLRTYTDVWKHFIPESQLHFFDNGGWFYTEVIPNKLAVFSVNTLYFFDRNAGVDDCERPSEPGFKQMEWLRIQLQELRRRGVKAILTGHVPPARTPGKQNWDETCWQKYNLWVTQFRDVIVGTIYGHMNIDHFLLHDSNDIDIQQMAFGFDEPEAVSEPILYDQSASISASADYLVDLRQMWSKLPDPRASARTTEDEAAEFSLSKKKPWKGIGNKYGERYHLSLVSPSIVPNLHVKDFPKETEALKDTAATDNRAFRTPTNLPFIPIGHIAHMPNPEGTTALGITPGPSVAWISTLYISHALQAKGLGNASVKAMEDLLVEKGVTILLIDTVAKETSQGEQWQKWRYEDRGLKRPAGKKACNETWYEDRGYKRIAFKEKGYSNMCGENKWWASQTFMRKDVK